MEEFSISSPDYMEYKLSAKDLSQAIDKLIENFPNHVVLPGPYKIFVRKLYTKLE